jgi:uncharacterized sulfatase
VIAHRDDPQWKWLYEFAFGKRPEEELYDIHKDRNQTNNIATDPAYAAVKEKLAAELAKKLTEARDPRVTADPVPFENPPFTNTVEKRPARPPAGK